MTALIALRQPLLSCRPQVFNSSGMTGSFIAGVKLSCPALAAPVLRSNKFPCKVSRPQLMFDVQRSLVCLRQIRGPEKFPNFGLDFSECHLEVGWILRGRDGSRIYSTRTPQSWAAPPPSGSKRFLRFFGLAGVSI